MKFTNGYWHMREEIKPSWATSVYDCHVQDDSLLVFLACTSVKKRGNMLNIAMLTLTLTAPAEGIIHVEAVHHAGATEKPPYFETTPDAAHKPKITITDEQIIFQSGSLRAVINRTDEAFSIRYEQNGHLLTESSYRNLSYMWNTREKQGYMVEQLLLSPGEYIYGLGERFTPFIKNGQVVEMWNEDGGTSSEIAYKNIPLYVSNRGYGVLVDTPADPAFEIASEKVSRVQFSIKNERLAYYVIAGPAPKEVLSRYTGLLGRPALPPAWSFGLWLTTSFTTSYDEQTVTSFIDGMAERNIPLSVFHFDCFWMKGYQWCDFIWDEDVFPDPAAMLERYKKRGLKICVWINPYIAQKSHLFGEGMKKGYLLSLEDGTVWQTDLWQPGMALVDFTNPDACKWYAEKLEALLDMGVDCFKTDFGERVPVAGIRYYDGSDPVKMHNYYTYLYNQTVFSVLEKRRGKGDAALFARSATAGGQKFPVHWGGDCSASYPSMAETLRGGLSLALGGFGFWSHDISGFEQTATPDIYKRWCAFGLLSSHSRLHGSASYRVPWLFDDEASEVLRTFVELKCRLMPYLFQQAVLAHETGVPLMRPMMLEFPEDAACETLDLQYMLGDSLLVAPVFSDNGMVRYYLPEGRWTHLLTGEEVTGGRFITGTFDYFSLPLFVRPGTVLATGNVHTRPDYDYADGVLLTVYALDDGASAETVVPDITGKPALRLSATRSGTQITLTADKPGFSARLAGRDIVTTDGNNIILTV